MRFVQGEGFGAGRARRWSRLMVVAWNEGIFPDGFLVRVEWGGLCLVL